MYESRTETLFNFLDSCPLFSTYGWYTEIQKLELLNNQALNKEFVYWLTLSETVDEKRINDLIELSDKYEVDLIKEVITDKENNYFLYGDFTNIQDFLYNQSLPDFHDITKFVSYSSTDGSMYVLDKEKNYNVYSINYLSELGSLRGRINLSSNDEMNIYQFEEEFKSKFLSDFISNYKIESEVSDQSIHFFDFYMNEMIVLSSLIFIISCFIVSKEVEKISILRLQGFSFLK